MLAGINDSIDITNPNDIQLAFSLLCCIHIINWQSVGWPDGIRLLTNKLFDFLLLKEHNVTNYWHNLAIQLMNNAKSYSYFRDRNTMRFYEIFFSGNVPTNGNFFGDLFASCTAPRSKDQITAMLNKFIKTEFETYALYEGNATQTALYIQKYINTAYSKYLNKQHLGRKQALDDALKCFAKKVTSKINKFKDQHNKTPQHWAPNQNQGYH